MEKVTILTTDDRNEAEVIRARLAEEGLASTLRDDRWVQRILFLSAHPHASEKVMVDRADYERAMEVLQGMRDKGDAPKTEVSCPECGSAEVEFPQMTRKFLTTALAELLMAAGVFPEEYYCVHCQHTWAAKPDPNPQRDVLNWRMDSKIFHPENQKKPAN